MREITAQEAYDLMEGDEKYTYLDVRSVPEYEAGHPAGAINIPIMHFNPNVGMTPNENFMAVVEANIPKDARLVIGCKSGGRSARACELLERAGYSNVANVRGGFSGAVDNLGRLVEPGWSTLNLPVSTEADEDARYEALATKK